MAAGNATPAGGPATQAKISPPVATAMQELERGETLSPGARSDAQGRLQVYVYVTDTSSITLTQLTQAGLVGMLSDPDGGVVQGWIATHDLSALAQLSCVKDITLPRYAIPR